MGIEEEYLEYLKNLVHADDNGEYYNYSNLIDRLWKTEYSPFMADDSNRRSDGISYRFTFAYNCGHSYDDIYNSVLNDKECSILEMMIALAARMEDQYLSNWIEDRTYIWFWRMIDSLGLKEYDDWSWNPYDYNSDVDDVLERFMSGRYNPNGKGGLFTIWDITYDCRLNDIWSQAMKWIHENMKTYNPEGLIKY